MNNGIKIAVVGASGLVGRTMVRVLEERNFPVSGLKLFASARSAGEQIMFRGESIEVQELKDNSFDDSEIALFSAGKDVSINFAPKAVMANCLVIDNGSYWRMREGIPLVVPEVNPEAVDSHKGIIANPNCSTIQLVVALKPIYDNFGLDRVVCSTYQSISGAGQKGVDKLRNELNNDELIYGGGRHRIAYNTIFHEITDDSRNSIEEIKMMSETRKIMELDDLKMSVTCVRLPVLGGHGESVNVQTVNPFTLDEIQKTLESGKGIIYIDEPQNELYPTVANAGGYDEVFVGRLRRDESAANAFNMWVTADNLRKGAASNAVQIAEIVLKRGVLN